jgi:hypothetical protein
LPSPIAHPAEIRIKPSRDENFSLPILFLSWLFKFDPPDQPKSASF